VSEFGYPIWFVKLTAVLEAAAAAALQVHTCTGAFLISGLAGGAAYSHAVRQRAPAAAIAPALLYVMLLAMLVLTTPALDVWVLPLALVAAPGGAAVCAGVARFGSSRSPASEKRASGKAS
jgi:hypothetical protein